LVLSVYLDNIDDSLASHKLQEAINLAKSLNINVLYSEFFKLRYPSPGNFLSTGHLLKFKEIGEDDEKSYEKKVQTITDEHINSVENKVSSKEKEIMTI